MARSELDDLDEAEVQREFNRQYGNSPDPASEQDWRDLDRQISAKRETESERWQQTERGIQFENKRAFAERKSRDNDLNDAQREAYKGLDREERAKKAKQKEWDDLDREVAADNRRIAAEEKRNEKLKQQEAERKKREDARDWKDTERRIASENKRMKHEKEQSDKELSAAEKEAKKRRLQFDKRQPGESRKEYLKRQTSKEMLNKSELKETTFAIAKTFGNIIVGGVKKVISDGHGRSGRRATLAYRRENREYNSEARRMRSQVSSPGVFNSKLMFGENRVPERTRYAGKEAFGNVDPLASFSMKGLGMGVAPAGMRVAQERHRQPRAELQSPTRLAKKGKKDPLADFNRLIGGF